MLFKYLLAVLLLGVSACSSNSYIANTSTDALDSLSPVGSRQVSREQQLVLASHYHIEVGYAADGLRSEDITDLNRLARDALARHLRRYFAHVEVATTPQTLQQALRTAASHSAQLLLFPRIENWPNIEPIRLRECQDEEGNVMTSLGQCEEKDEAQSDELVVVVGIYDVLSGKHLDSVHARSRRGVAAYLYEDSEQELEVLNQLMVQRLAPNARRY
ncbi:MAG: DUF4823 domain-containing protein [Pseudomonadota bacterium]|nr:DUF4823 domain-containing protein [Pseudomonadota bacterium]